MIDYRRLSAAVALISAGAVVLITVGPWSSAPADPNKAYAMALVEAHNGREATARDTAERASDAAIATTVDVASKADRLAVTFARVSAIPVANGPDAEHAAFTITTNMPDEPGTIAMPLFAFASFEPTQDAAAAISRLVDPDAYLPDRGQRARAVETPSVAEEDEEVAIPLPSPPQPRPQFADHGLPMPRLKPSLPPPGGPIDLARLPPPPARPGAIGGPPPGVALPDPSKGRPLDAQQGKQGNTILAYLGADPTAPTPSDRDKVILNTPFGVPFIPQTASVETACLRPELIDILRKMESHYHKKVIITSGQRSRGRPGSLHRQCAAADIVVPGVDAKALATFARSIPNVGGVGTYCHPEMIHVDIGTPRDWKYGCGSYFAMRDGSAHWGKMPAGMGME